MDGVFLLSDGTISPIQCKLWYNIHCTVSYSCTFNFFPVPPCFSPAFHSIPSDSKVHPISEVITCDVLY